MPEPSLKLQSHTQLPLDMSTLMPYRHLKLNTSKLRSRFASTSMLMISIRSIRNHAGPPPKFIFNPITSHHFPSPLSHNHLSPPLLPPSQVPLLPRHLFSTQWPGNPCVLKTNVQNLVVVLYLAQNKTLNPYNNL